MARRKSNKQKQANKSNKQSNNTQQQKPRQRRRTRQTIRGSGLARAVCAITDPFCVAAREAKLPDGNTVRSIPIRIRGTVTISTLSGGNELYYFQANPFYPYVGATGAAGNFTVPTSATAGTDQSWFSTNSSSFRIVSWGVRFVNTASANVAAGVAIAGTLEVNGLGATIASGSTNYNNTKVIPVTTGCDFVVIANGNPDDTTKWTPSSTYNSATVGAVPGWENIFIDIEGAPGSANVGLVEYVYNCEFVPIVNTPLTKLATPPARANPAVMAAASRTRVLMDTVFERGAAMAGQAIEQLAVSVLNGGVQMLTGAPMLMLT